MSIVNKANKGRYLSLLYDFTNGIKVDQYFFKEEVFVQKVWVENLYKQKILKKKELIQIKKYLNKALSLHKKGIFPWRKEDEDIHINIERYLIDHIGDTGKKIHIGRSRNDLIATTLRLLVDKNLQEIRSYLKFLIKSCLYQAEQNKNIIIPGMTHLQNGQPIRLSHTFLAYCYSLVRDIKRINFFCEQTKSTLPLGAAAMNGTTCPLNFDEIKRQLGFKNKCLNAYDAVSDRDFINDALYSFSQIALHLSRISEDIFIWSSSILNLAKLPLDLSTGSSIMPNKRNPDVVELTRAKSAKIIGNLNQAQILIKALPNSYNSDLHEIKSVYLNAYNELRACLQIFIPFIRELKFDNIKAKEMLKQGHILATDITNELTSRGIPFREAYQQVKKAILTAENKKKQIHELDVDILVKTFPKLDKFFFNKLNEVYSVEKRNYSGGTSLNQTKKSIRFLNNFLNTI